ncbi:MAG: alpha/beta fold hydrolase, partial [Myxococcales bacterium]
LTLVRNNVDSDVYLYDVSRKEKPVHVTPHQGAAQHHVATFTPDSRTLVYLTDAHGEFTQAWTLDLETRAHAPLEKADWDVQFVWFSEHGRYRITGINQEARTVVKVVDTRTGEALRFPALPAGDIGSVQFARSEKRMAFRHEGDTSPGNLHVFELESGAHRQLTRTLNPALEDVALVAAEDVRYPSFDGLQIPALLYRPRAAGKVPAVVWVHGGPGGQSRHGYHATLQHLLHHGYAVLAVNNRGSSGYGKTFFHLDDLRHGDVDLKDCVWGRKYLSSLDWVDGARVAIMGGSYGGYLTAAALAFEPDAFEAGVDIFGVTNWVRTLESIPPYWAAMREYLYAELGDPAKERERLQAISPLFHASRIKRPLLVIQGANDPRVLKVESDELVEAGGTKNTPRGDTVFYDQGSRFPPKKKPVPN